MKCGGCGTGMVSIVATHPKDDSITGDRCPNCGRVYVDHPELDYQLRLDDTR